jgi:spore coat polysaccharide biosynthesis protein SpsF
VAIIAVRIASKRLYGKPLATVEDKPILTHLVNIFKKVPEIDSIMLAISGEKENQVFVDYAKENGLPYYVDVEHDEEDVLGRLIRAAERIKAEHVVRATSEGPIKYHNISEVIKYHIKTGADLTFTEKLPGGTNVEVIRLSAMRKAYEFDKKYHCAIATLCMYEHPEMFKIKKITPPKNTQKPELDLDVDTESNLLAVREIFKKAERDENGFVMVESAIALVDKHPHLKKMLADGRKAFEGRIWE